MITRAIINNFNTALTRKWNKTYWAFDIHGTIIVPNYQAEGIPTTFYPYAKEALQQISIRKDIVPILYTCSHPHQIQLYLEFFERNGIHFPYVNENPEVVTGQSSEYGNYDKKFYCNVLAEDRAGFSPMEDWYEIKKLLDRYPESLLGQFNKD